MKKEEIQHLARETMSDHPSRVPKHKEPDADDDDIESIRIEPIDNGYMVHTHKKAKPSKGGELAGGAPQKHFFAHGHEAAAHVASTLGKGKK